jgi:ribonuclease PH
MNKNSSANGPEESWDPLAFLQPSEMRDLLDTRRKESQIISNDADNDNSTNHHKQKIFLKTDCISEATGSSYIEIGNTKLIVSVYGPRDIPRRDDYDFKVANLNCEFRFAAFSCLTERRRGALLNQRDQSLDERNLSSVIEEALKPSILLHKYPKSQIDLYILCIQNDVDSRNVLMAGIIASSMALANASIELYDLIACYTYSPINVTVSYMPQLHQITSLYLSNEMNGATLSVDLFKSHIKESIENCKKVYSLMRHVLVSGLTNGSSSSNESSMNNSSIEDDMDSKAKIHN